jgi:hypothetical protein
MSKTDAQLNDAMNGANKKVDNLTGQVKGDAAKAEVANQKRMDSLQKGIDKGGEEKAALNDRIAGEKNPTEKAKLQGELKTLENRIDGDKARLEACRQNAAMYKDPTSETSLAGAGGQTAAAAGRLESAQANHAQAQAEFQRVTTRAQTVNAAVQGGAQALTGLSQVAGSIVTMAAEKERARGAEHTANATKAQADENESAEFQKSFDDLMRNVQDIIKTYIQSQNQANAAIYRNM